MRGYSADLAYIHDIGFGAYASGAAPGVIELLQRAGIRSGLVVELGCGSGILASKLSRTGYSVLGIDISMSMIRLARKNAPEARFMTGSLLEAKLPVCDAIVSVGECVNYCFDTANSAHNLSRFFRRAHTALRSPGLLIFDIAEPGQVRAGQVRQRFVAGADWAVISQAQEHRDGGLLTRTITSFRKHGSLYRRTEETHELKLYRAAELAAALRNAGFRTRTLRAYGSFKLPPKHAVLLGRR